MTTGIGDSNAARELADLVPAPGRPPPITRGEFDARLARAREQCAILGIDALIISAGASLRYYTGIAWGASERLVALVLPRHGTPWLVCPAFELGSLAASVAIDAEPVIWQEEESPALCVATLLASRAATRVGLDPMLPFTTFSALRDAAPALAWVNAAPIVDACRATKSAAELACLQYAKSLTLDVQRRAARILREGITTAEVRRFIDSAHRAGGADNGSTFCAVQFGVATAYPHGVPGEQALRSDDLVLIDTGCQVHGYHSDITRTYVYGRPSAEHRRIWAIEHEAQAAAFAAVRPGVTCETIDATARAVLASHGLGPDYRLPGLPHRTGHGVGLSIHEGPYLVRGDTTPLAPGMCFSNEPMIVLKDAFGIRLEDHFHVTEEGAVWFTEPSPSIDAPFG